MAAKRASLNEALDMVTPQPAVIVSVREAVAKPASIPSREGTVLVGAHLPSRYGKAMKLLSAEVEKPQRDLLEEALNMLLVKYGAKSLDK